MEITTKPQNFSNHFNEPSPKNRKIIERAIGIKQKITVAVVNPATNGVLQGPLMAAEKGLAEPILIGRKEKILQTADEVDQDISKFEIYDAKDDASAMRIALGLVKEGKAQALMRGLIPTSAFMKAALDKEIGIRTSRRASHCLIMDVASYDKILICTDAAINIAPDLITKKHMIENAVEFSNKLGISNPQVALLSFVENVAVDVPATTEAAVLCKMAARGQIKGCVIDGPLSVDLAISKEAMSAKNFTPILTQTPDILVFPDLNSANIAVKIMDYFAAGQSGGLVLGMQVPIILMRRSSPAIEHVISFALAKIYCAAK